MIDHESIHHESIHHTWFISPVGFAEIYLSRCGKESRLDDNIDIQVYTKLVQLDSKLGTRADSQFFRCLKYTARSDIIKVKIEAYILIA